MPARADYAHPFRIGPSGQADRAPYAAHVAQLIRQVLLTAPGERVNRPDFGCGLRELLFAPDDENVRSAARLVVREALDRLLAREITVRDVRTGASPDRESALLVEVEYVLRDTGRADRTVVEVR